MAFEMTGLDELIEELDMTQTRVVRATNKILRDSAEPLKEEIIKNTPVGGDEDGRSDVHITNVKRDNDGLNRYLEVGYGQESGWYMYFHELGTYQYFSGVYSPRTNSLGSRGKKHPRAIQPKHMVERATETARPKVIKIQTERLNDYLNASRKEGS